MSADRDRFSTTTRLKALGSALVGRPAARVYRVRSRRMRRPRTTSRLTGRAALLALIVCSLAVALAYPMRQYVAQRTEIAEQRAEAARVQDEVDALREEQARWRDPAYVEQQARLRLHFTRPGERGYVFTDGRTEESGEDAGGGSGSARSPERESGPWYENLWRDVDEADRAD